MVGEIYVVNKKTFSEEGLEGAEVINIMRPSILGNPFHMSDEEQREIVAIKFYHYLRKEYAKKEQVYNELLSLSKIVLGGKDLYLVCCCAPRLCHGNIIKKAIAGIIKNACKEKK